MTAPASQRPAGLRVLRVVSTALLALGLVLLALMVTTEGEPGLLPLLLVVAGIAGRVVARLRTRRAARDAS